MDTFTEKLRYIFFAQQEIRREVKRWTGSWLSLFLWAYKYTWEWHTQGTIRYFCDCLVVIYTRPCRCDSNLPILLFFSLFLFSCRVFLSFSNPSPSSSSCSYLALTLTCFCSKSILFLSLSL